MFLISTFFFFLLEYNCFTMLCLLYNEVYICPLPPGSPSLPTPSHPSRSSQSTKRAPCVYSRFPLAIYFTQGSGYMSIPVSQLVPPCLASTCPFAMPVSPFLPWK